MTKYPEKIFSGDYSKSMWDEINNAQTKDDLKSALYIVCCRLQNLEEKLHASEYGVITKASIDKAFEHGRQYGLAQAAAAFKGQLSSVKVIRKLQREVTP